jgi:catechol 2,3-dioxygenase-like lactoylglutathione lyase family enzyme
MLRNSQAFSSFAVRDLDAARDFYSKVLGVEVSDVPGMKGLMQLNLGGGVKVLVYPKADHTPATYTVLNFRVPDVERTLSALGERGVKPEIYKDGPVRTNEKGIAADGNGPRIAWFKDPSGNILSILDEK